MIHNIYMHAKRSFRVPANGNYGSGYMYGDISPLVDEY